MLSKQMISDFMARERESFTWMKKEPRGELLKVINELKVKPVFKGHDRWTHQLVCFYIGMCYPEFLFMLDMGLGKTAIHLDLITQRLREKKMDRALITVPRIVNLSSWKNDIEEHSDLEPNIVFGSIEEKKEILLYPKGEITVVDLMGLQLAMTKKVPVPGKKKAMKLVRDEKATRLLVKNYQYLGIDESHKAKTKDTLRFTLLSNISKFMAYKYSSSGTMFGRNPEDLWAQFYLIDKGYTLGETLGLFRSCFFTETKNYWGGFEYKFRSDMTRTLYRFIQNKSIRYSDHEVPETELPEKIERVIELDFADHQRQQYLLALEGLINSKGKLRELDNAFIRMRQITSGYVGFTDDDNEKSIVYFDENPKLQELERWIEETGDEKVVVSCEYTATGRKISEMLKHMGVKFEWLYGGTKDPLGCVDRFKANPDIKVFLMNSESGGTGTDGLQKVARYLIFYESPVSPITRQQTLKRIYRSGQRRRCMIVDLTIKNSIDNRVLSFIKEGKDLHSSIVDGTMSLNSLK